MKSRPAGFSVALRLSGLQPLTSPRRRRRKCECGSTRHFRNKPLDCRQPRLEFILSGHGFVDVGVKRFGFASSHLDGGATLIWRLWWRSSSRPRWVIGIPATRGSIAPSRLAIEASSAVIGASSARKVFRVSSVTSSVPSWAKLKRQTSPCQVQQGDVWVRSQGIRHNAGM